MMKNAARTITTHIATDTPLIWEIWPEANGDRKTGVRNAKNSNSMMEAMMSPNFVLSLIGHISPFAVFQNAPRPHTLLAR